MKNLQNIGLIFILLFVLGCNCQSRLQELADQGKTAPTATPSVANTSTTPDGSPSTSSSPASSPNSAGGLTLAKYEQLKDGMSYREVADILGMEGDVTKNTKVGTTTIKTYEFKGKEYEVIYCNFTNDKMSFKSQANLK